MLNRHNVTGVQVPVLDAQTNTQNGPTTKNNKMNTCFWIFSFSCLVGVTIVECFLYSFSSGRNPLTSCTNLKDYQPFNSQRSEVNENQIEYSTAVDDNDDDDDDSDNFNKIRFRGRVAYEGSGFRGWQVQSRGRTCQGAIEQALSLRFNRTVKIVGAGRTDAGVHARGQAFHFDLYPHEIVGTSKAGGNVDPLTDVLKESFCHQLQRSLNRLLEDDIRVYNIMKSPDTEQGWHAIYSAKQKLYTYRISLKPNAITCHPLQRYTRVHIDGDIDPDYLQRILRHYEGEHDFRAFAGAIEANLRKDGLEDKNTVRTVYSVDLIDEGEGGHHRIEILLKGALYKMVRNMVGTALDVCRGRLSEEAMLQMLHHCNNDDSEQGNIQFSRKDNKCKPAPPEGLTLEKVYYYDDF